MFFAGKSGGRNGCGECRATEAGSGAVDERGRGGFIMNEAAFNQQSGQFSIWVLSQFAFLVFVPFFLESFGTLRNFELNFSAFCERGPSEGPKSFCFAKAAATCVPQLI